MNASSVPNHTTPLRLLQDGSTSSQGKKSCGSTKTDTDNTSLQRQPPQDFICPLTMEVMNVPVMTLWGHNFERSALMQWIEEKTKNNQTCCYCPLTRNKLTIQDVVVNRPLQAQIQYWKHQNPSSSSSHNIFLHYVPDSVDYEKIFLDKIQTEMEELHVLRKSMLLLREQQQQQQQKQ